MTPKPHSMSVAVLRAFITNKGAGDSAIMGALDDLEEQLEAWQALSTRQDAFIRYLRPDLDASRSRADHLVERFNALSNPASRLRDDSSPQPTEEP